MSCEIVDPGYGSYISFTGSNIYKLNIKVKDFRKIEFLFNDINKRNIVLNHIKQHSFFGELNGVTKHLVFAFSQTNMPKRSQSWIYSPFEEYKRLKFNSKDWKDYFTLSNINENYGICSTYPSHLIFPSEVTTEDIQGSASFRSSNRLPAIVWFDSKTGATLSRSSQPAVGVMGNRNKSDENLITSIFRINKNYGMDKTMWIIDARSTNAARANALSGYGYENEGNYGIDTKIQFLNIPNIHSVRKIHQAFYTLCTSTILPERVQFESTNWFETIKLLLLGAIKISKLLEDGSSVLVHCSDGWDRTAQLTSLVQLMIDPFFRTLKGFSILIQKEWLSFGHKFGQRTGIGMAEGSSNEISPIFDQWMDAVFQILSQYPNWFEFNEDFLISILDYVYDGRFGNFLFNCEKERKDAQVFTVTPCVWTHFEKQIKENPFLYTNPYYQETTDKVYPIVSTSKFVIWNSYYQRYNKRFNMHLLYKLKSKQKDKKLCEIKNELKEVQELLEKEQVEKLLYYESFMASLVGEEPSRANVLESLKNIPKYVRSIEPDMKNCEIRFTIENGQVKSCIITTENEVVIRKFVKNMKKFIQDEYKRDDPKSKCFKLNRKPSSADKIVTYKYLDYISSLKELYNTLKEKYLNVVS